MNCNCRSLWSELLRADDARQVAFNNWTDRCDDSQEDTYVKAARYAKAIRIGVAQAKDRHPGCLAPFAISTPTTPPAAAPSDPS
jgi:hypothetical protein